MPALSGTVVTVPPSRQFNAGDVAGVRTGEEDHRRGNVGGIDVAPQPCACGHAGGHLVGALAPAAATDSTIAVSGAPVTKPGVTTLTRTWDRPNSLAMVREAVTMALFVAV